MTKDRLYMIVHVLQQLSLIFIIITFAKISLDAALEAHPKNKVVAAHGRLSSILTHKPVNAMRRQVTLAVIMH